MAVSKSDCKTCHNVSEKSIGPAYEDVAKRYKGKNAQAMLANKIIEGGSGNWGKNIMAAHPQHSQEEASDMVKYILSLTDPAPKALPMKGEVTTSEHVRTNSQGYYVMRANYTDKGSAETGTLTGSNLLTLRHPKVQAEDHELSNNVSTRHMDGTDMTFLAGIQDGSFIAFRNVDLLGVKNIYFKAGSREEGSVIEIRSGNPGGPLLGKAEVAKMNNMRDPVKLSSASISNEEQNDLYFVFRNTQGKKENILFLDWLFFDNGKMSLPKP
jgi:cytochrome c